MAAIWVADSDAICSGVNARNCKEVMAPISVAGSAAVCVVERACIAVLGNEENWVAVKLANCVRLRVPTCVVDRADTCRWLKPSTCVVVSRESCVAVRALIWVVASSLMSEDVKPCNCVWLREAISLEENFDIWGA